MNKALARLDKKEVFWKAKNGMALSLLELALVSGYSHAQWRSWQYRGLPTVQDKISLKRALAWINKNEMAPNGRIGRIFDLCENMHSVLFTIWLDINLLRMRPKKLRDVQAAVDEITAEFNRLHSGFRELRRLHADEKIFEMSTEEDIPAEAKTNAPQPQFQSPFTKQEEAALCKGIAGMALNLRELATASGYSYSTISQWKRAGLPLIDGKITRGDALAWRRSANL